LDYSDHLKDIFPASLSSSKECSAASSHHAKQLLCLCGCYTMLLWTSFASSMHFWFSWNLYCHFKSNKLYGIERDADLLKDGYHLCNQLENMQRTKMKLQCHLTALRASFRHPILQKSVPHHREHICSLICQWYLAAAGRMHFV